MKRPCWNMLPTTIYHGLLTGVPECSSFCGCIVPELMSSEGTADVSSDGLVAMSVSTPAFSTRVRSESVEMPYMSGFAENTSTSLSRIVYAWCNAHLLLYRKVWPALLCITTRGSAGISFCGHSL